MPRAARALAERVSQVHTLVEAIPDTLWVVAPEGKYPVEPEWPSPRILNTEAAESAGASAAALAPPEHLSGRARRRFVQTAHDGLQRKFEYRENGLGQCKSARLNCDSIAARAAMLS